MYFSEQLSEFYEKVRLSIIANVGEKGVKSEHANVVVVKITNEYEELQITLEGNRYLTEVGCYKLFDNHGYQYEFGQLDYEDLCALADHLEDL